MLNLVPKTVTCVRCRQSFTSRKRADRMGWVSSHVCLPWYRRAS